jgi:hypothetical protein
MSHPRHVAGVFVRDKSPSEILQLGVWCFFPAPPTFEPAYAIIHVPIFQDLPSIGSIALSVMSKRAAHNFLIGGTFVLVTLHKYLSCA